MAIIVIEDDASVRDAIVTLARQGGHEAWAYPDGESLFRRPPPDGDDTVIVDLALPGVSGAHVVQWLESLARPPRIVVISGQSAARTRSLFGGRAPRALVRKPLSASMLAEWF